MDKNTTGLKRDICFEEKLRGFKFRFCTTWGLFSPKNIDEGSKLLIDSLSLNQGSVSLDLGCGYGPIGLTAAKLDPKGKVHMVDKDYVAVEYTRKNTKLNYIGNCNIYLSNGFDRIPDVKFDNIFSNLPAKVGKEMLEILLKDSKKHLKPGGKIYLVTLSGLKEFIKRNLNEIFGNYEKIAQNRTYIVFQSTKKN